MRIGIITGEYPPMQGGVGDYSRELSRALVYLGHEVFILTSDRARPLTTETGITVQPTVSSWGRWGKRGNLPNGLQQAEDWVQANHLDVVNVQYEPAAYDMHAAANDLPRALSRFVPVITTFHDLLVPYLFPKAGTLRKRIVYQMARQSHGVIVTNIADERELLAVGNMPPITRIPIGSNIAVSPPASFDRQMWREKLRVSPDVFLIGYFGFLNASKGVDTLAQAVRLLVDKDVNVELLIIGGQTDDSNHLQQADEAERLIGGLGINRRVRWTGFVEAAEVSANLMASDVIALPYKDGVSFRRGTLMAALAHGCAIVTTYPEVEIPELVDREIVLMVPPNHPQRLAETLLELLKDENLCHRLRKSALDLAVQFRWDTIAAATLTFMQQLEPTVNS